VSKRSIEDLLKAVRAGRMSVAEAGRLLSGDVEAMGFAHLDVARELRTGVAEAVFCEGKAPEQIVAIAAALCRRTGRLLATRADRNVFQKVKEEIPGARYFAEARTVLVNPHRKRTRRRIAVVSAGTSDIPVAEEAAVTAEFLGNPVDRVHDVGVAGIHRLLAHIEVLRRANALVVVAGMEGALASVVGGLVSSPVVAVPTSVGYGASFNGIAALLAMLNSCSPGVTVVNIDNGFGAGVAASLINSGRK
jgi:hypothetical protein